MKQIPINLAARPFERTQRIRRALTAVTIAVLVLSTLHAGAALLPMADDASASQPRSSTEATSFAAQLQEWQREADLIAAAADPQRNREVAQAVTLANALIAWRALPWGSLFDALEAALPEGVRLELVQPSNEPDGVLVELIAAAASRSDLDDLLSALERQPALSRVVPLYEERGEDGRHLMRIRADFRHTDQQVSASR